MAHKAIDLDPISISSLHNLGWVYLVSRKFEEAEETFTEALALHPNWTWGYIKRAYSRMFQGKYETAQQDVSSAKELIGEWGSELLQVAMIKIYRTCENEEKVSEYLKQFFDRINDDNYTDPFSVFYAYCFAGDIETGLDWAERTVREKAPGAYQFNLDIFYTQEMLENPRFIKVRESMNF